MKDMFIITRFMNNVTMYISMDIFPQKHVKRSNEKNVTYVINTYMQY